MRLGFIGTGKITSSVVTGICRSRISFKKNNNITQEQECSKETSKTI